MDDFDRVIESAMKRANVEWPKERYSYDIKVNREDRSVNITVRENVVHFQFVIMTSNYYWGA